MSKKMYSVKIVPLTGVHIGTGEELIPLDYKVTNTLGTMKLSNFLYLRFSSENILGRLIEEGDEKKIAEFERASAVGNMRELQKFFHENCISMEDVEYPCAVTREFTKIYGQNLQKDPYENAAKVFEMYRPAGKKTPVIPGSSLKGSIRTAVLNDLCCLLPDAAYDKLQSDFDNEAQRGNIKQLARFDKKMQSFLLKNIDPKDDPFRSMIIRDAPFSAKGTQIVGVLKNISYKKQLQEITSLEKLQIQAEAIRGKILGGETAAETQIIIDESLQDNLPRPYGDRSLSMKDIIVACNNFYLKEFKKEYSSFYRDAVDDSVSLITDLYQQIAGPNALGENEFVIRVGRWSQVEFITYEENLRHPETRVVRGKEMGYGGTRTVFNYDGKLVPMGWCKCTVTELTAAT